MNSNKLLFDIAKELYILQGNNESDLNFKTRIIYSVCGLFAYAALWDRDTDIDTVSIKYVKNKIKNILLCYIELYPEVKDDSQNFFLNIDQKIEDIIIEIYQNTGMVYCSPYRLSPSIKNERAFLNILFQRGLALDDIAYISGIGFYNITKDICNLEHIKDMFNLCPNIDSIWEETVNKAIFTQSTLDPNSIEFLNLNNINSKYWSPTEINIKDKISIMRAEFDNLKKYYLYRYSDNNIEISHIPDNLYDYQILTCACLKSFGVLPSIRYTEDGQLTYVYTGYLLPFNELNFLKLYSWPNCNSLDFKNNFNRQISTNIFQAIKAILSDIGFEFEEKSNDI